MGRPLQDKFFATIASDTGETAGLQIRLKLASYTGGPADDINSYITRQRTTSQYEVSNGTNTEILQLTNQAGEVATGKCTLVVTGFGGSAEFAKTLSAHQVKTFEGNTYTWSNLQEGDAAAALPECDFDPTLE